MEEEIREVKLKNIGRPPSPLNLHIDENTRWSKEEMDLFKHYGGKSIKDRIITLCSDLEETALRIQYGLCTEDREVMSFMPFLFQNIEDECKRLLDLIILVKNMRTLKERIK